MANLNRDYLVTLDVKTSNITLSSPMTFYVTDRRTMNIFVKLVMNMSNNPVINDYVALENAIGYRTELVLVSPNNQPFYLEGELLNGDEALFCFNLDTEQISKIGNWVCELRVYSIVGKDEEIVTSNSFLYSVNESITTSLDDVVLDDTTYGIIDELIGRIEDLEGASPGGENDTRLTILEATKYDDVQVQKSQGKITLTFYAEKMKMKTVEIPASEGLEQRVSDCEESIAWLLENGGGGGGVVSAYLSTTDSENFILTGGTDLELHLDFYSPNIGKGTLKVTVDDVDVISSTLSQGESTVVITGDLLHKGVNVVKVYAVDRVGVMTNTLVFNVRYGSTELTTTFDPYQIYDVGAVVRYYFTAVALNTADKLKFHMTIDGQAQAPVDCVSDVRAYFTFPILNIGSHYCEAWVEDSYGKSNTISFNFVILDDNSLAINSTTRTTSAEEGAQLILDYRVYMKNNNKFITETYIDNELINTGECNADTNYYTTSSLKEGQHTIKIVAYNIDKTVSDYVSWVVNITPSTYEMKQPVTTGAIAMFTAKDRTNSDQDRSTWTGKDQDGAPVVANLSGFSYDADNGWNNNELIISGKSTVEIPIAPLANNARYGFTLDVEFTSKQIGAEDAEVLTLWNETDNCGIRITTERLILRSKAGNECNLFFSDNENVSAMFIIDRDEKVAKIYLNGVMCEAFSLSDYVAGGQTVLEDFTVDGNIILGGGADKNGYCKIKNLRVYEVALATNEILNNWLSNITDKTAQRDMEKFQNGDDLPTLTVYCDFAGLGKDDKKPCDIIYYSPNVTKYGESFTLSGKTSQLQYQGTSSMQYPIKNYRLNLRDIGGKKWYYNPYDGGQGECRFTLKADFMSSGHWQNTGLAKFVSDKLYGYKTNDLSTMNPAKRYDIQNGGTLKDTRDSINGFPCRLILVNDGTTPLNEGQQEPTPGNTKDMGIFNFNNDKDNVTSLGLDTEIFPNALSYEVTANSDTSAGAFVPYEPLPTIDMFLGENNYITTYVPLNLFSSNNFVKTDGTITTAMRYLSGNYDGNGYTMQIQPQDNGYVKLAHNDSGTHIRIEFSKNNPPTYIECKDGSKYALNIIPKEEYPGNVIQEPYIDMSGELAYLQQSFELRYPDEDDVGKDYGYLGMKANAKVVDIIQTSGGLYHSSLMEVAQFGDELNIGNVKGSRYAMYIYFYGSNGYSASPLSSWYDWVQTTGATVPIPSEAVYVTIQFTDGTDHIIVNGETYYKGNLITGDVIKEPYLKPIMNSDYGLKRVIDWVGNCTDEEFVADYEKYFDKHYLLRYYLLVITLGMVDNLGKNMMLDTWDGQIWYPRFYDMDTICSYDNSGAIKFDVDIEMEQGYWNTSASRLWTKVRDLLHDELVVAYKDMRASGLSYDGLMNYFYGEQISKIPQKYYNMDADVKYLPYADEYLGKAHGNGYEHLKRWLKNRLIFVDTLFDYGPSYESDMLTIRANTLDPITFEIETYTPVYQHVSYYNGQMSKLKIDGKTATTFTGNAQTATDQEILIYGGSNIKRIRGISSANPDSMLIGNATKLAELDISNCPILIDVNSNKANFAPHQYLNKLNIENCPQLGGTLELTYSPLIQEIKAKGTAVNGLRLPTSVKNLETLELPNTISSLALHDATSLETLKFDEGVAMQSIELSNCTGITNVENFDLAKTPTVILDNSYNTDELYMSETTNLTLRNMSNLERVIYTPNSEYSEFDINNVINGKNYKITANACPKLSTFITTAPYRLSYNNDSAISDEREYDIPVDQLEGIKQLESVYFDSTAYVDLGFIPTSSMKIELDVKMEFTKQYGHWLGSEGSNKIQWASSSSLETSAWSITPTSNLTTRQTYTISCTTGGNSSLCLFSGHNESGVQTDYCGKGTLYNCKIYDNNTLIHNYIPCDMLGEACLYDVVEEEIVYATGTLIGGKQIIIKKYGDITPNTAFTANTLDLSATQFTDIKLLCTTDVYNLKVPTTMKNFYCDSAMDIDTDVIEDASYEVIHEELIEPYTTNYEGEVYKLIPIEATYSNNEEEWVGKYVVSGGNLVESKENWMVYTGSTDYIPIKEGVPCSIQTNTGKVGIIFFDESKTMIGYKGQANEANTSLTMNSPISSKYVMFWYDYALYSGGGNYYATISYYEGRTPNIIPSSANGSLIFNMYSNNTTQPTSASPYMWDLTGLKLNDFHTFGMNNNVKPSDDSYMKINTTQLYGVAGRYSGNSFRQIDTSMHTALSISPILFEEDIVRVKVTTSSNTNMYHYYANDYDRSTGTATIQGFSGGSTSSGQWEGSTAFPIGAGKNAVRLLTFHNYAQVEWFDITTQDVNSVESTTRFYMKDIPIVTLDEFNEKPIIEEFTFFNELDEVKSITMPQRMPGYSVRLVNADITPNEYPTMLYPKWIDTGLPITGKLDYTKYNGTSLAWAYAYTTGDVEIKPLDSRSMGQITHDYNKLYGTDFVDVRDVWVYKDTDVSGFSTNEAITKAYIELTDANFLTRIDEVVTYYPNCKDLYFFDDGSVTSLAYLFHSNGNDTYRGQFNTITFMEGYFNNLLCMNATFWTCSNLTQVNNIPISVNDLQSAFYNCNSLKQEFDFSEYNILNDKLRGAFINCQSLTYTPILPSNYKGSMSQTFSGCSSLITPPAIPQGVTSMSQTFSSCKALTTVPAIPSSVTDMGSCFENCTSLVDISLIIPSTCTTVKSLLRGCTSLENVNLTGSDTSNVTNMERMFNDCTKLATIVGLENLNVDKVTNIFYMYWGCLCNTVYIPLTRVSNYGGAIALHNLTNGNMPNITWRGVRSTDFDTTALDNYASSASRYPISQADIQELVPGHLADLLVNKLTIVDKVGTLNDTYSATTNCRVGNFIIGSYYYDSTTEFSLGTCRMYKAILNGVEIIPILDESGNPCFLNTQNNSKYYNEQDGGTLTAGSVVGKHGQYDKLDYIMAVGAIVRANDITVESATHNLEYYMKSADAHAMNSHIVNQMVFGSLKNNTSAFDHTLRAWNSAGFGSDFVDSSGTAGKTKSASSAGKTLTLGETYLAFLTEDEIAQATSKAWTLQ